MELKTLKEIGLEEKEAKIYLELLKKGSSPASKVANELGLDRTSTYYILLRMMDKGFISALNKGNVKYFSAIDPKKILSLLKEKEKQFSTIIPNLESLSKLDKGELRVEVFKGKEGLNHLYRDVVNTGGEVLVFGVDESKFIDFDSIHFDQYIRDVDAGKIKERLLTFKGAKSFGSKKSQYKFIPKDYFQPTPIALYGSKVAMIVWQPSLHIILIDNKELNSSFKKQFKFLWKKTKP